MKRLTVLFTIVSIIILFSIGPDARAQSWQRLHGGIGSSSRWGSGWLDLAATTDFKKGDRLRLSIGGSATKVLIRLLSRGESPDDAVGIIGEFSIPPSRNIEVTLKEDRKSVIQISVHGGPNPWGKFPLGGGNGPATLQSAERGSP